MTNDIDPESGFRLPLLKREDLGEVGRRYYDRANTPGGHSIVGLRGPAGIRLYSENSLEHAQGLNRYLRFETRFSPRIRETAILVTAREMDCQFEWTAHEPEARKQGVTAEVVDVIKHRKSTDELGEIDATIIDLGREIFVDHKVSPATFARAKALFGSHDLVELVMLMGMYASTAALLIAFDMQLRPGQEPLLPEG